MFIELLFSSKQSYGAWILIHSSTADRREHKIKCLNKPEISVIKSAVKLSGSQYNHNKAEGYVKLHWKFAAAKL